MYEYENTRRIVFDCGEQMGNAVFIPVCEKCGRFVKANDSIVVNQDIGLKKEPNAKCSKCGNVEMLFEGFF